MEFGCPIPLNSFENPRYCFYCLLFVHWRYPEAPTKKEVPFARHYCIHMRHYTYDLRESLPRRAYNLMETFITNNHSMGGGRERERAHPNIQLIFALNNSTTSRLSCLSLWDQTRSHHKTAWPYIVGLSWNCSGHGLVDSIKAESFMGTTVIELDPKPFKANGKTPHWLSPLWVGPGDLQTEYPYHCYLLLCWEWWRTIGAVLAKQTLAE